MYYLILLVVYSLAQIALGVWIGRRVRTTRDFFVAGRSLGPGLLFSTMLAANIGAGSTVGAAALGYRDGLAAVWWVGAASIGSLVLALWVGPAMRRTAAAHDLRTVGDFLEFRFGVGVRTTLSVLLWAGSIFILAAQLIAIATILNVVVGLRLAAGCVLGGFLITIYFTAGGLLTSAWVNVVQLTVKLIGFAIALPLALSRAGGWSAVAALHPTRDYWSLWHRGESGILYLAVLGPAFVVSPGLLQKIYGARDDRTVRVGVGLNAASLAAYAMVPVVLGMIARVRFPELASPQLALPTVLKEGLPAVVGGLGLAAVFSAELSSADAALFMLTTSLSQDLYRRFVAPHASDAQLLRITRITAVAAGTLGVLVALVAASVITALTIFYTLMSVSLFVPIVGGLYVPAARSREAMGAVVAGVATVVVRQFVFGGARVYGITPAMAGLAAATGVFAVLLALRRGSES
ncbi:MAG: solute:Na+ symporter, family [Acidobacteriota bacterium]|jgi:SSS family solute:Na+ symporter